MTLAAAGMIQVPCTADNTQQWEGLYYPVSFCPLNQYVVVNCTLFTLLLQYSVSNSLLSASHQCLSSCFSMRQFLLATAQLHDIHGTVAVCLGTH